MTNIDNIEINNQYQGVLQKLVESAIQIFSSNLTGVYLHGSLAMGCFNPVKSDLDLIYVVEQDIIDEQKKTFMNHVIMLNQQAPQKGIELSIVKREYCEKFVYPTPFTLHFSNMHLQWYLDNPTDYVSKMKGVDKDLAAHFTIINHYGVVLYGADIKDTFSNIPKEDYLNSIWEDIRDAKEDIQGNPVYIILNLCRVAAFVQENKVVSKKQGGEWGLKELPVKYHDIISSALKAYVSEREMQSDEVLASQFCEEMLSIIAGYVDRM
ncbi:MAG TPA: aminoglycoside adenylyltransferase domain-containing protein [Lachnospiraceae bacterium]|nr:aminoglycoside adenylyltransferase domain-containing protein [Lachnospiraceae bacterium]